MNSSPIDQQFRRRIFTILLTSTFVVGAFTLAQRLTSPEEVSRVDVIRRATPAVVKISGILRDPNTGNEGPVIGAGFFYSSSRIITAYHVIQDLKGINIELYNGRTVPGQIFAVDKGIDLAILSVKGITAPAKLSFAGPGKLSPGMGLIVIGSPFGQKNLASYGSLAGQGTPELTMDGPLSTDTGNEIGDVLFVDAVMTAGNSGGPVLDLQGKVIGVSDAILSDFGSGSGFGVVLPGALVQQSVSDLEKYGVPQRGSLGALLRSLEDLDPLLLRRVGLVSTQGAMVEKVDANSPALKAGIKGAQRDSRDRLVELGDIILSINGKPVKNARDVTQTIARFRPGEKVKIVVWRKGKKIALTVTMVVKR